MEEPLFQKFYRFYAEQIDGLPAWEKAPPVWIDHERAEKNFSRLRARLSIIEAMMRITTRTRDFIVLPLKRTFSWAGENITLLLCMNFGHWTGHADRLNRDMGGRFGDSSYAREELRAEISSMMMSRELGLPHNPDRHAGYVGDWVKVLTEEPMEVLESLSRCGKNQKIYFFSFLKSRYRNRSGSRINPLTRLQIQKAV